LLGESERWSEVAQAMQRFVTAVLVQRRLRRIGLLGGRCRCGGSPRHVRWRALRTSA
jgi:hypothetical protein